MARICKNRSFPAAGGRLGAILLVGLIFLFSIWLSRSMRQRLSPPTKHQGVGRSLLEVHLQGPGPMQQIDIDTLRGSVVLLNFWGTWCPPCRMELPHITALAATMGEIDKVRVLAVSCGPPGGTEQLDRLRAVTADYLARERLELPVYTDIGGFTRRSVGLALGGHLQLEAYPTTILLDERARIRAVWIGYLPGSEMQMQRQIEQLLAS
jgi:thiol-disulfide isomerase/thioredoxin